jgi:cytochrome c553
MTSLFCYTVSQIETDAGKACARIRLQGRFIRDKLHIPIQQEEMHYLIWTTFVTAIEDRVEGEFVFDLQEAVMRSAEIRSTYHYWTLQGRKADQYRSRVLAENIIHTRIVNQLAPMQPDPLAGVGPGSPASPSETDVTPKAKETPLVLMRATSVLSSAADGKKIWENQCVKCHGRDGKGNTQLGKKSEVKDFTDPKYQESFTDEEAFEALKEGVIRGQKSKIMKAAQNVTDEEIKALIACVRAFKK